MYKVTVANFKGGTRKSTTSGFLAHAFEYLGWKVAAVDTDPDQATLTRWAGRSWPTIPAAHLTHSRAAQIDGFIDPKRFDVAVVDTPPLELRRKTTLDALKQATDVVIPMGSTFSDWDALEPMWPALNEASVDSSRVSVLFTGVRGRVSYQTYREMLEEAGRHVLSTAVPALESYAQAMAGPVRVNSADYYVLAAEEISQRGEWIR